MAQFSVVLPDDKKEALQQIADARDRSLNWLVRLAIDEFLHRNRSELRKGPRLTAKP